MRAKFGSDPTAGSKILSFKFISRYIPAIQIVLKLTQYEVYYLHISVCKHCDNNADFKGNEHL